MKTNFYQRATQELQNFGGRIRKNLAAGQKQFRKSKSYAPINPFK